MTAPYFTDGAVTLHLGDALEVARHLPSCAADCIVTSPPYYALRNYGVDGQYGLELSPAEYVGRLRALFGELRRVLADDGTLWLNLGDSYNAYNGNRGLSSTGFSRNDPLPQLPKGAGLTTHELPAKNLIGIPWRVAFALQDDGWILRSDIVWSKRNFMPESVTDRPTRAHEYVFLMAKSPRYWYDADAIREQSDPRQQAHNERYAREYTAHTVRAAASGQPGNVNNVGIHSRPGKPGRNARSVWSISAQPFPGAHFAVMPPQLAERCVVAGCKPGGTVLDPFNGSGTTGLAAQRTGRKYIGIDINREYLELTLNTRLREATLDFEAGA
ncbi:DNA-methyltransferase [Mycobacterium kansasii]|uniref:DNA-methyltransferase n=1 Tax=Mycobacterium kansasii TaxID=1768 RepID=UPI0009EF71B1|nr:site-specific DNA-methyltransferase [Mycobacterium kansasii]ARG91424.1 site-specific DNA-methyltransferase [Mycobacterium kansasii]